MGVFSFLICFLFIGLLFLYLFQIYFDLKEDFFILRQDEFVNYYLYLKNKNCEMRLSTINHRITLKLATIKIVF